MACALHVFHAFEVFDFLYKERKVVKAADAYDKCPLKYSSGAVD